MFLASRGGGVREVRGCCVTSHRARDRPTPENAPLLDARDTRVETPALSSAVQSCFEQGPRAGGRQDRYPALGFSRLP